MNNLSIRHWRYHDIRAKIREAKEALAEAEIVALESGYRALYRNNRNRELFYLLTLLGFFDYHRSNRTRRIIYEHQVVHYLTTGWHAYKNGKFMLKDQQEIHHLDHDVTNNNPSNLVVVTPAENKLLANCLGGFNFSAVKDKADIRPDFFKLVLATIRATTRRLGFEYTAVLAELNRFTKRLRLALS